MNTRPLPDYAQAFEAALQSAAPLGIEEIALGDASGRILAAPVAADRDVPPFNRASMDGYAMRHADLDAARAMPVVEYVHAGSASNPAVPPGHCVAIATGASLPDDCDTIIQHERSDRADPVRLDIDGIGPGHAVHPRGADARAGDIVLTAGQSIGPAQIGIAAMVGATTLPVRCAPRVIVLSSGDEIVEVEQTPQRHQIRNSNGPMVRDVLRRVGAGEVDVRHVADALDVTRAALAAAIGEADVVISIGGISAGQRDHFPTALDDLGVQRTLQGAAIQPGKPILVGRSPSGTVVIGLPGNPVSSLACACLFAWPVMRAMLALPPALPWRDVVVGAAVRPNAKRQAFRPACLRDDGRAEVPTWAGSGDLIHAATTDGLLALPRQAEEVAPGDVLPFLEWPQ